MNVTVLHRQGTSHFEWIVDLETGRVVAAVVAGLAGLGDALDHLRGWNDRGFDVDLVIDLTVGEVLGTHLAAALALECARHDVDPSRLQVHAPASEELGTDPRGEATLRDLADLGVGVVVAGRRFDALLSLRAVPIRAVEIDTAYVDTLDSAAGRQAAASIAYLAQAWDARCIARGVRSHVQIDALLSLGCRFAAGPALPASLPVAHALASACRPAS